MCNTRSVLTTLMLILTINLHAFTKGSQLILCPSQLFRRLRCMLHKADMFNEALMKHHKGFIINS